MRASFRDEDTAKCGGLASLYYKQEGRCGKRKGTLCLAPHSEKGPYYPANLLRDS